MQHPMIIAHRGESIDAPENTLAAINLAWERGAAAVEIDIQLTKDKHIVVIHDTHTKRIAGVKKRIKNTLLSDLRKLDAGVHKGIEWEGERIPMLSEVLKSIPQKRKLIIEIKSNKSILTYLKDELLTSGVSDTQIELIAFNANTLAKAKLLMPQFKMLWLLDLDYSKPEWLCFTNKNRLVRKVKRLKLDGVDVWAGKILNRPFISTFKKAGLLVYAWTVNNPKKAEMLINHGIDGITTDRAYAMNLQLKHIKN